MQTYSGVFGYNGRMERYKKLENNFLQILDKFDASSRNSAIASFSKIWVSNEDYYKHLNKRLNKEGVVIDEHDYMQKTFNALNSKEVFFEVYKDPDLWDRVFYSKDDKWAVVVAQNGKILTSYKIHSTIDETIEKHKKYLDAKVSKIELVMNLEKQLDRLQKNLENFDLESFFHDETFFEILEDREFLEKHAEHLTQKESRRLHNIDRIIDSYYNIYKDKKLEGYAKMSFKLLSDVEKISSSHLEEAA